MVRALRQHQREGEAERVERGHGGDGAGVARDLVARGAFEAPELVAATESGAVYAARVWAVEARGAVGHAAARYWGRQHVGGGSALWKRMIEFYSYY